MGVRQAKWSYDVESHPHGLSRGSGESGKRKMSSFALSLHSASADIASSSCSLLDATQRPHQCSASTPSRCAAQLRTTTDSGDFYC